MKTKRNTLNIQEGRKEEMEEENVGKGRRRG
jgi:hypothetical protein